MRRKGKKTKQIHSHYRLNQGTKRGNAKQHKHMLTISVIGMDFYFFFNEIQATNTFQNSSLIKIRIAHYAL